MASTPARCAAAVNREACAQPYPAPATTGTCPSASSTAARITWLYSVSDSEKYSPVPQTGKIAPGPAASCFRRCARNAGRSTSPSIVNGVSGKDRTPWAIPARRRATVSTCRLAGLVLSFMNDFLICRQCLVVEMPARTGIPAPGGELDGSDTGTAEHLGNQDRLAGFQ